MWHVKDNGQSYLFCKGVFIDLGFCKSVRGRWSWAKIAIFQIHANYFFFGKTLVFERFFYHNTIPVGFYRIFTYIWFISLWKFTQLQENKIRLTGWTLSCASLCSWKGVPKNVIWILPFVTKVTFVAPKYILNIYYLLLSITIYCLLYMFLSLFLVTFVPKRIVEGLNKNKVFQRTRILFG